MSTTATLPVQTTSLTQGGLARRNAKLAEMLTYGLMRLVTYLMVFAVGYIVFDIVANGLPAINWEFVSQFPRRSGAQGGILPAIVGTISLVTLAIGVALPLGVASAVYLNEYAKQGRFTDMLRLAIVTLAGVPSIVFGLFGLALFVLVLGFGASILAGGLTLACMILPTIIVASEESLKTIPKSFREGSLALGATRWQTIFKNVLPYAMPGILTGTVLSIGRAAGETAPILLTVAAFFLPVLPGSVFDQVMALPYHLYVLATQHPEAAAVRPMQYGTALLLLLIVLGMSLLAIVFRNYFRGKYRW
ncbi:MAG: phosphate ABC transporter permease PstA [Vampirovibrio sp.]|nr:phosphate ABC transporter permease PstA [Vampirovibrio sp.]